MPIVLMWENFGPYHHDRIRAVAAAGIPVAAIQLFARSAIYDWEDSGGVAYPVVTLARSRDEVSDLRLAARLVMAVKNADARDCYFCHYENLAVFMASAWLRLTGHRPHVMLDSKYDDYSRKPWRERIKRVFLMPYVGALVGGERSRAYLAGLGIDRERTCTGYSTLDIGRLAAQGEPAATAPGFAERPFLIVARLVPKKNIGAVLRCFAQYLQQQDDGRRLDILGEGPSRAELEALARELGISGRVNFAGHQDSAHVSEAMRRSLVLLLPSISEQFGLVVNEALANSLPVIVSRNCGAVDVLVDDGENGFVIDAMSEPELLEAMTRVGTDEDLWRRMSAAAAASAPRGDVRNFVDGIKTLSSRNGAAMTPAVASVAPEAAPARPNAALAEVNGETAPVAMMWENFGPYHHDRIRSLPAAGIPVVAIQLFGQSEVYEWEESGGAPYPVVTLARSRSEVSVLRLAVRLVRAVNASGARDCYFCHYENPAVFLASVWLRLTGRHMFNMTSSKHDDYRRKAWQAPLKRLMMLPYRGAIAGSERTRNYLADLGIGRSRSVIGYDTIDIARMATQGETQAADTAYGDRPFLIVARLIPKKNVPTSLRAFARYCREHGDRRRLEILGDGPLRAELEALARELGVAERTDFRGLQDSAAVSDAMRRSLALLLPSTSEQFGLVVNEAFANALPAIVSRNCGAADVLLDDGENGFVIDAMSEDQLFDAMTRLGTDYRLWRIMSAASAAAAPRGDVNRFANAVRKLSGIGARDPRVGVP